MLLSLAYLRSSPSLPLSSSSPLLGDACPAMLLIACLSVLGTGGYQSCPIRKEYWIEYFLIVIYKVFFRSHFSILASVLFIYVCALLHFCHSSLSLFFFVSVIICSLFQFYCLSFIFLIVPSLSSIICSTKLSSFGFLLLKFCPALQ